MDRVRTRIRVEGVVQGVYYRYSTRQKAEELGVSGWVRNHLDGSVECLAEGARDKVEALIQWCRHGPPGARVDRIQTQWEEYKGDVQGFSIQY